MGVRVGGGGVDNDDDDDEDDDACPSSFSIVVSKSAYQDVMASNQSFSMQTTSFSDENPMAWATLNEQPYFDAYAGGQWTCGGENAWGVVTSDNPSSQNRFCTSCPPCKVDRFATRMMVRDAGPPCCTTESYEYNTGMWPFEFAGGSTCPNGPDLPLFQDLYTMKKRPKSDFPLAPIYDPYLL